MLKNFGPITCTKYFKIKTTNFVHTVGVFVSQDFHN